MATQTRKSWPTWMVVVAVLILIPPLVWALSITLNILAAMSIGGILIIALLVWVFARLKDNVDA